jgi:colanic acid/amylovoran biosynthesis glycosyltransferase
MTADRATDTVAYVMTHYPRVALSFISNEIDAVERLGLRIQPMAMNAPSPGDLDSAEAKNRHRRTLYLKDRRVRLAGALIGLVLRHPLGGSRLVGLAIRSARTDIGLAVRRLAHLAQAAVAAEHCRRLNIRRIHAQFGLAPATVAWFAAEILNLDGEGDRARWSFTIHGFQDFIDEAAARLDLKARFADFVVCISDFTRSQLFRVSDAAYWDKAVVVRCGIDLDVFAMRDAEPQHPRPRILCVGRISPEKGQAVLVRAAAMLAERQQPFQLRFVGDGPFAPTLREEIGRLGLDNHVELLGELPPQQVREELAAADLFCLPSFSEGLPVSIMEAMAVGVPVVATNIAGIPELAVDGVTARTVAPADPAALADALQDLLGNADARRQLAAAARKRVEARHDLHQSGVHMHRLLTQGLQS